MNVIANSSSPICSSICDIETRKKGYAQLKETRKKNLAEYIRLVGVAIKRQIDISEYTNKMEQIISDRIKGEAISPTTSIKMLYEIKMFKKYNLEIGKAIAKHSLFHKEETPIFNMFKINPKTLTEKLEKQRLEYQNLITIANNKDIDVSEPATKMAQVLVDLPDSNDLHQFESIRMLYEVRMYEKYNLEIGRKIAQQGLFRASQETQSELELQLTNVIFSFREWMHKAAKKKIDVSEYKDKMEQVVANQPESNIPNQFTSIATLNLIKLGKIYCIQMIRKIAETEIRSLAETARTTPGFEHQISLINGSEQFLLKQLPTIKLGQDPQISQAVAQYQFIMDKMEDMKEKIMKKIRKV